MDSAVTDNRSASRFELVVEGKMSILDYERKPGAMVFLHTEVPPPIRRRGIGEALVKAGLDAARGEGRRIVAVCPFVAAFLRKHPEYGA